ncbi:MAG: hypothetical protein JNG83_02100 [Opitutaceae bacterium]|nr:hypothetical protein [Opitutaceae bacterium]
MPHASPPPDSSPSHPSRREFLRRSALSAASVALAGTVGAAERPSEKTSAPRAAAGDSAVLAERADDYLRQILEQARGPGGLLISHCQFDTRLPIQEGEELPPFLHQVLDSVWGPSAPKPTVAEWYYGENTLWATGWLLLSQMIRHRVTGEPEALAIARKCFRDLNHLFDLSRTIEPGLLGKPHGGRAGATTSFDQSANPVLIYAQFARTHGTPAEQEQARRNLLDHGNYFLRRDWTVNHHGNLTRIIDKPHPSAMKYFAAVHAAYDLTGETRFRDEVAKHVRTLAAAGKFPWPGPRYELNGNLFYYSWLGEYWSRTSLADAADWIGNIGIYWQAAQRGLDAEGLLLDGMYDTQAGVFTPVQEGWFETNPPSAGGKTTKLRWWRSPTGYQGRTFYTLSIATLGLLAQQHGLDPQAHQVTRKILLRMDRQSLRQCWDDGKLPPEMKPYANLFGVEFPGLWLVAYWMGRERKFW